MTNPLLQNLRLPGETVRLPSEAQTYDDTVVSADVLSLGELHVYPMTTYEEILMKTPDLLYTGQAIVQTFARCIPQINDPLRMYSQDVNFLLIALRKSTYGDDLKLEYKHTCDEATDQTYDFRLTDLIASAKSIEGHFGITQSTFEMPNKQIVTVRPFLLSDVIEASQRATAGNVSDMTDLEFVNAVKDMVILGALPAIVSVDSVTNTDHIREWLESLPSPWIKLLGTRIEEINSFGADLKVHAKCKDCGELIELTIPLNPQSFFTLPSEPVIVN